MPIAEKPKTNLDSLFALGKDFLFPTAQAVYGDPNHPFNQYLNSPGSDQTIVLWDPLAALTPNPSSVSLTQSNLSAQVQFSNTGSIGSTSTWNTNITYQDGNDDGLGIGVEDRTGGRR